MRTLSVIARYPDDGNYYLGKISSREDPVLVCFPSHNGIEKSKVYRKVPLNDVIPYAGSTSCPKLKFGDHVLVKVKCQGSNLIPYFPGLLICQPLEKAKNCEKFYTVLLYTDKVVTKQRHDMVRISEGQYNLYKCHLHKHCHSTSGKLSPEHVPEKNGKSTPEHVPENNGKSSPEPDPKKNGKSSPEHGHQHCHTTFVFPYQPPVLADSMPVVWANPGLGLAPEPCHHQCCKPKIDAQKDKEIQTDKESNDKKLQTDSEKKDKDQQTEKEKLKRKEDTDWVVEVPDFSPVKGDEVLARWEDDGWYYFGVIEGMSGSGEFTASDGGSGKFLVRDVTGHTEEIDQGDIFIERQREYLVKNIKVGDFVIATHPDFKNSYAPGQIGKLYENQMAKVEFYDLKTGDVPYTCIYVITAEKYVQVITYIKKCIKIRNSEILVARDDDTGFYHLCKIIDDEQKDILTVQFTKSEKRIKQKVVHIFRQSMPYQRKIKDFRYVLAPLDDDHSMFLPAKVVSYEDFNRLELVYCHDSNFRRVVAFSSCIYISEEYYGQVVAYFIRKTYQNQQPAKKKEVEQEVRVMKQVQNRPASPVQVVPIKPPMVKTESIESVTSPKEFESETSRKEYESVTSPKELIVRPAELGTGTLMKQITVIPQDIRTSPWETRPSLFEKRELMFSKNTNSREEVELKVTSFKIRYLNRTF